MSCCIIVFVDQTLHQHKEENSNTNTSTAYYYITVKQSMFSSFIYLLFIRFLLTLTKIDPA